MRDHTCEERCVPWCPAWVANGLPDEPKPGFLVAAGGWQAPTQYLYPTPDIRCERDGVKFPTPELEPTMDRIDIIEKLDAIADQMARGLRRGQGDEVETLLHGIRAIDALAHKLRSEDI